MDTRLLELLVCPICKGPLDHQRPPQAERTELIYAASEARQLDDTTPPVGAK